jgi:iron(II)-dependent oxidoreductase
MKKQRLGNMVTAGILALSLLPLAANAAEGGAINTGKSINYSEMVTVPAGKFIAGKIYAKQEVTLPAFQIDKYEVTNEQYAKVAKVHTGHEYSSDEAHQPAVFVSQVEAEAYCKAVGKRLPSGNEWEKAARGTDGRLYPWGNDYDESAVVSKETAEGKVAEVGTREKGKSPYGAMDMAGNVWEWTTDYDGRYVILRGGSFYEEAWASTVLSTLTSIPEDGKKYTGFRCVRDIK